MTASPGVTIRGSPAPTADPWVPDQPAETLVRAALVAQMIAGQAATSLATSP